MGSLPMNRRNFLQSLLAFSILPSAKTYNRVWKITESGLAVPVAFTISDIPDPSDAMLRFHEYIV